VIVGNIGCGLAGVRLGPACRRAWARRGFAPLPGAELLSLACPRESNQRERHPEGAPSGHPALQVRERATGFFDRASCPIEKLGRIHAAHPSGLSSARSPRPRGPRKSGAHPARTSHALAARAPKVRGIGIFCGLPSLAAPLRAVAARRQKSLQAIFCFPVSQEGRNLCSPQSGDRKIARRKHAASVLLTGFPYAAVRLGRKGPAGGLGMDAESFSTGQGCPVEKPGQASRIRWARRARRAPHQGAVSFGYFSLLRASCPPPFGPASPFACAPSAGVGKQRKVTRAPAGGRNHGSHAAGNPAIRLSHTTWVKWA
jgi:hypothetical protein